MIPIEIAMIVFLCVFGGALLGMFLHSIVPQHHLTEKSKEVIKLGMGLIATMTALVLGLLISTAKSSYDAEDDAVKRSAAKILLLDRVLANYGPETKETRELLRRTVAYRLNAIWSEDRSQHSRWDKSEGVPWDTPEAASAAQSIEAQILQLLPNNDNQRWLKSRAQQIGSDIMETRWLVLSGIGNSIPAPFLVVVVFWVTIIFMSFGLIAPRNATVIGVLFLCALSVAGSIFLILEMGQPFEGLINISSAPLRYALSHLGQ